MNAYTKEWDKKNRESVQRRSARRQHQSGNWTAEETVKRELFKEQGGICALCGAQLPLQIADNKACQVDHLVPVAQGGGNENTNLVLAHRKCNQEKAAKNLLEYIIWRERAKLPRSTYSSEKLLRCLLNLC